MFRKLNLKLVVCIVDWCTEGGMNKDFATMQVKEVFDCLWRFYEETGSKTSGEYSRSALLGVRNAIEPLDRAQSFHKQESPMGILTGHSDPPTPRFHKC